MRSRPRPNGAGLLILAGLSVSLAGCSTGSQNMTTSSLAPRPEEGMYRDGQRRYPDGSYQGRPYDSGRPYAGAERRCVDPGQPTPREVAAYDSGHGRYGTPRNIETASVD